MARAFAFSIIVPTFNRAASLERLLASLRAVRELDRLRTEVLVVNNGSTDNTLEVICAERKSHRPFELELLAEPNQGKANALNRGLAAARGNYILVIDDDVVVDSSIIKDHWECYQATDFAAVQGRVLPGYDPYGKGADLTRLREYNIPYIDYGDRIREIRGLTGTNMSFKREVLDRVGLFDVRLGPGAAGFSEDTEFSIRIRKAGFKIGYTPNAIVYHELNPSRYGREYNRMVEYRKGLSRSIYRKDSIVFRVIPNLVANCIRFGFYRLLGKSQKAYKTEGRIMKCWGYLAGKAKRGNVVKLGLEK
jgi:GT2 family glycosyltransferase